MITNNLTIRVYGTRGIMSRSETPRKSTSQRVGKESSSESDEEVMRKIENLMKDQKKFEAWIASRAEAVVKHWPKR